MLQICNEVLQFVWLIETITQSINQDVAFCVGKARFF